MKRTIIAFIVLVFGATFSFAQKIDGFGGELSVFSLKANYRNWLSKINGFEIFGGVASELNKFHPNDAEAGFKYLHALIFKRTERTYLGVVGKWKRVVVDNSNYNISLPIFGIFVGKEWLNKRIHLKGFAIEMGYQFGSKEYKISSPLNYNPIGKERFEEFPLIINLRYSYYSRK